MAFGGLSFGAEGDPNNAESDLREPAWLGRDTPGVRRFLSLDSGKRAHMFGPEYYRFDFLHSSAWTGSSVIAREPAKHYGGALNAYRA